MRRDFIVRTLANAFMGQEKLPEPCSGRLAELAVETLEGLEMLNRSYEGTAELTSEEVAALKKGPLR